MAIGSGKSLLVCGATGGMGRACSLLAAERGYSLILADLYEGRLDDIATKCRALGADCQTHRLDVRDRAGGDKLARALAEPGIDALIYTVGLSPQMADWQTIIEVDLVGSIALLEAVRPALKTGSCAVCIASMSAHMVPAEAAIDALFADPTAPEFTEKLQQLKQDHPAIEHSGMAYARAKKALKDYVCNNGFRWGREGKRIVSVSPGLIDTDMGRLESDAIDNFEEMTSMIALERLGEAEDIARVCLFLISSEAAYVTGCDLLVDGGFISGMTAKQAQAGPG